MIPKRFHFHTFSFFMSLLMSGVMSLAMLMIEAEKSIEIMAKWPEAWSISMLVAFPVSMFIVPLAQKIVSRIVATH